MPIRLTARTSERSTSAWADASRISRSGTAEILLSVPYPCESVTSRNGTRASRATAPKTALPPADPGPVPVPANGARHAEPRASLASRVSLRA